jgi:acetylornithine deacetylase
MNSIEILDRLIGFPTVSAESNLDLVAWVRQYLAARGVEATIVPDATGTKASLHATIGPRDRPGLLLSAHTDVVPVAGQTWSTDPFALRARDGRLYGRGTADMKGFVACALRAADAAARQELATPLHLSLSHDEEIGCVGVRRLIEVMAQMPVRPRLAIVGEPTSMAVAIGHKGKTAARAVCTGLSGHSALAPYAVNAIHLACDFVAAIRARQAAIAEAGQRDSAYDVPYTTLHAGRISGGTALNIVPDRCELEFEIRNLAADDPQAILDGLGAEAARIAAPARRVAPEAGIEIAVTNAYPGLDTAPDAEVVTLARELAGTATTKVAFGTEAGLFSADLGVPTVVCGPGDMAEGHKPDEFVSEAQLAACDAMLDRLVERLTSGL